MLCIRNTSLWARDTRGAATAPAAAPAVNTAVVKTLRRETELALFLVIACPPIT
jgi:hypothetical protein